MKKRTELMKIETNFQLSIEVLAVRNSSQKTNLFEKLTRSFVFKQTSKISADKERMHLKRIF